MSKPHPLRRKCQNLKWMIRVADSIHQQTVSPLSILSLRNQQIDLIGWRYMTTHVQRRWRDFKTSTAVGLAAFTLRFVPLIFRPSIPHRRGPWYPYSQSLSSSMQPRSLLGRCDSHVLRSLVKIAWLAGPTAIPIICSIRLYNLVLRRLSIPHPHLYRPTLD